MAVVYRITSRVVANGHNSKKQGLVLDRCQ